MRALHVNRLPLWNSGRSPSTSVALSVFRVLAVRQGLPLGPLEVAAALAPGALHVDTGLHVGSFDFLSSLTKGLSLTCHGLGMVQARARSSTAP